MASSVEDPIAAHERRIATWMREFDLDREAAECGEKARRVMQDTPEEFENIFAFFVRRILQEIDDAKEDKGRWYCRTGERRMFDSIEPLMKLDDENVYTHIFQHMSLWKAKVEDKKEEQPVSWSVDKRWSLVPVVDMLASNEMIEAKYGSPQWHFLYAARKEGAVAMRAFLNSREIRREDTKYIRDRRGRSALHFAATTGNTDMIPFFPDLVNAFDHDGYTPLHTAIWFGKKDFVEAIIRTNADVALTSRDNAKMLPVEMAREYQWYQTENLINSLVSMHHGFHHMLNAFQ